MTINEAITATLEHFEWKKLDDGRRIVVFKEGTPEALRSSVYGAHDGSMPNNWVFEAYYSILERLGNYTIEELEYLEDIKSEVVDAEVDVYNADLIAWLATYKQSLDYVTQAIQEGYASYGEADGAKLLAIAQNLALDNVYSYVTSYITQLLENEHRPTDDSQR